MIQVRAFFKLVRWPNLLIIAVTQYVIRYCIILPMLKINGFALQFSSFDFFCLVLSTISIAAAGYVINDYFDTKTDSINRPHKIIVGKYISRRAAILIHTVLNVLGVFLGFYISFRIHHIVLGIVFPLIAGILWFYSTTYKRNFLIGNFIVAFLTACVPLLVAVYDIPPINRAYSQILLQSGSNLNYIFNWALVFSYFAFLLNLNREIIKDVEDFEGDQAFGRNTLPIVLGIKWTKVIITLLNAVIIFSLFFFYWKYLKIKFDGTVDFISLFYFMFLLVFPLLIVTYKILTAKGKSDYHAGNIITKFVMLFGLLYAVVADLIISYSI